MSWTPQGGNGGNDKPVVIYYDPTVKDDAVKTNYDRIISKSPEELAELFAHICCPYSLGGEVECNIENKGCKACWLDWLKQEMAP